MKTGFLKNWIFSHNDSFKAELNNDFVGIVFTRHLIVAFEPSANDFDLCAYVLFFAMKSGFGD